MTQVAVRKAAQRGAFDPNSLESVLRFYLERAGVKQGREDRERAAALAELDKIHDMVMDVSSRYGELRALLGVRPETKIRENENGQGDGHAEEPRTVTRSKAGRDAVVPGTGR